MEVAIEDIPKSFWDEKKAERERRESFKLGTPAKSNQPLYTCQFCCLAFTGPISEQPFCPNCGRSGDGVIRIRQDYVVRRFTEAAEHATIDDEYRDATPIARLQKHMELGLKYREVRPMAEAAATEEKKPKAPKVKNDCACGCETKTGGTWAPGHDAKFYSAIRKRNAGKMTATEVNSMFPAATIKKYENNVKDHGG